MENTERVINKVRSSDKEAMTTVTFRTRKEDYEAYKKRCDELHIGYTEPLREFVRDVVVYGLDKGDEKRGNGRSYEKSEGHTHTRG